MLCFSLHPPFGSSCGRGELFAEQRRHRTRPTSRCTDRVLLSVLPHPQKDGGMRPIMDLRPLNEFITYKKFRMTTLQSILPLLESSVWMATLDLKDAYFHVTIILSHRKYFRFTIGDDHYQFKALSFGLSSAPWVFTKTMVVLVAHLRSLGLQIFPYLDDWLLVADSEDRLRNHIHMTLSLLHILGISVSHAKSWLAPSWSVMFIGAQLDSIAAKAFLPSDRVTHITALAKSLAASHPTARRVQQVLGHMASTVSMIPTARMRMRPLQLCLGKQFKPHLHSQVKRISLPNAVRLSLQWWMNGTNLSQGKPF